LRERQTLYERLKAAAELAEDLVAYDSAQRQGTVVVMRKLAAARDCEVEDLVR
jgi:hypothetical protein